jgi:Skp family chaperone for outer membrane proteins
MKRLLVAAAILTALVTDAAAQVGAPQSAINNAGQIGQHAQSAADAHADDKPKTKANDKAYSAALKNLPDKPYDPWRGVR